jgi:hypothetical protein
VRFDTSIITLHVKATPFEADSPSNLVFEGLGEEIQSDLAPATALLLTQSQADIPEGFIEGQLPLFIGRDEAFIESKNLA